MNRKVSIGFGAFALVLTALVVIPQFVNLESFKPKLENRLTKVLGQKVTIEGPIALSLLPNLGLKFNNVKVANPKWADDPDILSADEVTVSFSLLPLLTKTIEVSQISLVGPVLNLQERSDGANNWDTFLDSSVDPQSRKPSNWSLSTSLPRVAVQKGVFKLQGGQTALHVRDYQLSVKSISGTGPFVIQGHLFAEEHKIDYTLKIGETSTDKIDVDTVFDSAVNHVQIKGKYDKARQTFKGNMGSRLNLERLSLGAIEDSGLLKVTSDVTADARQFSLTNIIGAANLYQLTGQATLTFADGFVLDANMQGLPGQTDLMIKGPLTQLTRKPGKLEVVTQDIKALAEWMSQSSAANVPKLPARLTTQYALTLDRLKLDQLTLTVADETLKGKASFDFGARHAIEANLTLSEGMLDLHAQYGESLEDITADLSFKHAHFGDFLRKISSINTLNVDKFSFKAKALRQKNTDRLYDINIQGTANQKRSSLEGEVLVTRDDGKATVTADLNSTYLVLDSLFVPQETEDWSEAPLWRNDLFDLVGGSARLSVAKLDWKGISLTNVDVPVTLSENKLSAPMTAVAGGAPFSARLTIEQAPEWGLKVDAFGNRASLNSFFGKSLAPWVSEGTLDLDIKLKTVGLSPKSWMQNMRGNVHVGASNGVIKGLHVQDLTKRIKTLKPPVELRDLLTKNKAVTPYNQIVIKAEIEKGLAQLKAATLEAKSIKAESLGTIDLGNRRLDLQGKGQLLNYPDAPDIQFSATGDLFDPAFIVQGDDLLNFLTRLSAQRKNKKT